MSERDADLLETQLFAALKREEQLLAWMREAKDELTTLGMDPGFVAGYPMTAEQYRDLAARCPIEEEDQ